MRVLGAALEVIGTEVQIIGPIFEHVIGGGEDLRAQRAHPEDGSQEFDGGAKGSEIVVLLVDGRDGNIERPIWLAVGLETCSRKFKNRAADEMSHCLQKVGIIRWHIHLILFWSSKLCASPGISLLGSGPPRSSPLPNDRTF